MIREINKTTTGVLRLSTMLSTTGGDGVYLEYRNDADESVYRIEIVDGVWKILNADGTYTAIYEISKTDRNFRFLIYVDLDNNRSTTYINETLCGTHPLLTSGDKTNILNFRFATPKRAPQRLP